MARASNFRAVLVLLLTTTTLAASAAQVDIPGPAGSVAFGTSVTVLPNGNIVVTDPDGPVSNVGAVHLYSPAGTLISTLTGSSPDDHVGKDGITVLTNGNFVVRSLQWDGAAADVGAVTWVDGTTGLSGAVSQANSLIGTTAGDQIGSQGVTALSNGNYVVASPDWHNGMGTTTGAVTWGNGTTGTSGVVSTSNSLYGATVSHHVGSGGVVALGNGNYVVSSPLWRFGFFAAAGAVTWADGSAALVGIVSPSNSVVGTSADDQVGSGGVIELRNGNYVVLSPFWDNTAPATGDVGAVTWVDGSTGLMSTGLVGAVSSTNSLIGATASDYVGEGGVTALSNGHYAVVSPRWNNVTADVGAVTWGNGLTGSAGTVATGNSLIGTSVNDRVGDPGVTALRNGNYVVASRHWDSGTSNVGAVTWVSGSATASGVVSPGNSLIGTTLNDAVGIGGVTALSNGNYVVASPLWSNGATTDVGAVTWGNGTAAFSAAVSPSNSLIGTTMDDEVGSAGVVALNNGHFVVISPEWDDGTAAIADVGAVTWVHGGTGLPTTGLTGAISPANSLVGMRLNDRVGSGGVIALTNGNYVVSTTAWNNAVPDNNVGAVTWANGSTGLVGVVAPTNSLIGEVAGDNVGSGGTFALDDGSYVISSPSLDYFSPDVEMALTLEPGDIPLTGVIHPSNSVITVAPGGSPGLVFDYDLALQRLAVGRPLDNILTLFTRPGAFVFADGFE